MNFTKVLTPSDTEEIKPGLFIQRRGNKYRQISPAAWDGKIIWKNLLFHDLLLCFLLGCLFFI